MTDKFPNFFIVGAARAGTTSLYRYLGEHPEIHMSSIKEPHFFCRDILPENFRDSYRRSVAFDLKEYLAGPRTERKHIAHVTQWEDYLDIFRDVRQEKAVGESSTGYLYSRVAARAIRETVPDAKIIVMLRNPVERAFSHFLMDLRIGDAQADSFMEALALDYNRARRGWGVSSLYVEIGRYYEQVKRYLDIFPRENVRVVFFDEFRENTAVVVSELYEFLGVDPDFSPNLGIRHNAATVPRHRGVYPFLARSGMNRLGAKILPDGLAGRLRRLLFVSGAHLKPTREEVLFASRFFREDMAMLSTLLNRDLSHWSNYAFRRWDEPRTLSWQAHPRST